MQTRKRVSGLMFALLLTAVACKASELVTADVSQRWPWEPTVDIDLTLGADSTCDIESVSASCICRGVATNFALTAPALDGSDLSAITGKVHFAWDPRAAGLGDEPLLDFKVQVRVATAAEHKYLVCNLETGAYHYLADVPAGGWTDYDRTTNMVFRRIPAGSVRCGVTSDEKRLKAVSNPGVHTVRFSSDYYLAVFPITFEQSYLIENKGGSHYAGDWMTYPDCYMTYNRLRGALTDGINWPTTRYEVGANSIVDRMRRKFGGKFLFDLPQEEQWELAARGGDDDNPWPGWPADIDLSLDENNQLVHAVAITNFFNTFAMTANHPLVQQRVAVGTLDPNPYGLYDMFGLAAEWTLDAESGDYGSSRPTNLLVDPVGRELESPKRIVRGAYPATNIKANDPMNKTLGHSLPGFRSTLGAGSTWAAGRLAIHLNPLDFNVH